MNRILRIKRRVESGMYDDPKIVHAKLNGSGRERFLSRVGIDDPDVVHPDARGAAGVTIALALMCGTLGMIVGMWCASALVYAWVSGMLGD